MGADPYEYFVGYDEDVQSALDKLRADVFQSGDFHGSDFGAQTPEEALELTGGNFLPGVILMGDTRRLA